MMNPEIKRMSGVIPREKVDAALPRIEQELREVVELTNKRIAETQPTREILDSRWDGVAISSEQAPIVINSVNALVRSDVIPFLQRVEEGEAAQIQRGKTVVVGGPKDRFCHPVEAPRDGWPRN